MKRVYMAEDGTIFESKSKCEQYENEIKNKSALAEILGKLCDFCDTQSDCEMCPLYKGEDYPCTRVEFDKFVWNKRTV